MKMGTSLLLLGALLPNVVTSFQARQGRSYIRSSPREGIHIAQPTRLCSSEQADNDSTTTTATTTTTTSSTTAASVNTAFKDSVSIELPPIDWESLGKQLLDEATEISTCLQVALQALISNSKTNDAAQAQTTLLQLCDDIDAWQPNPELFTSREWQLRKRALEFQRYERLGHLLSANYEAYVATASFLNNRIPRDQFPNVQDVPFPTTASAATTTTTATTASSPTTIVENGVALVADCELDNMTYQDSWLDQTLLSIFRKLVEKNTGGVTSSKPGIEGLLEQGRQFMLQPGQTPEAQHRMVYNTLGGLMTPVLPPFYRIFMSGIVPKLGTEWDGKQLGPWFYAPWLTSVVTPTFFAFLVGPSKPNRRKDGQWGGLVVEKCKFLQESGCKGLCLHQCKLPAQEFFQDALGLPLTVSPNFVTQECQWSFGEVPLPPSQDPSFPKGCLVGCESRKAMVDKTADICN